MVVKSVCHLMTYHNANRTIVASIVSLSIKERRLQNACGETYLVGRRIVISINCLGRHEPFVTVGRLVDMLFDVVSTAELCGALAIFVIT